jgi:hypothetical protein
MTRALKQPSSGSASCSWCDRPFQLRQSGGHAQRFCSPCRENAEPFSDGTHAEVPAQRRIEFRIIAAEHPNPQTSYVA